MYPRETLAYVQEVTRKRIFIAALFTIAKTWKQPKCSSVESNMNKLVYSHNELLYSSQNQWIIVIHNINKFWDFPGGAVVKNPPANAGTWVWSLVWEDPTCHGANKPVCHNYWACTLQPVHRNCWAHMLQLLKPAHLEPVLRNKRSHRNEKPVHCNKE